MTASIVVLAEVWRDHTVEPGVTEVSYVVLRVEGTPVGDGWALSLCERESSIPWGADVLTAGERRDIEDRLGLEQRARERAHRRVA